MYTTAMPRATSRRTSANNRSTSGPCKQLVGSSISTMRASAARARQISTICRAGSDRSPTRRSGVMSGCGISASRARARAALRSRSTRPQLDSSTPSRTFSATVRCGQSESSWWMSAMPRRRASCGESGVYGAPPISIVPASGRTTPASTFISVLFPAPFSPSSAWTSPYRTSRSTPPSASVAPYRLATPVRRSATLSVTSPSDTSQSAAPRAP
jgi:hypothetical protein